jgi:hypothetical protein
MGRLVTRKISFNNRSQNALHTLAVDISVCLQSDRIFDVNRNDAGRPTKACSIILNVSAGINACPGRL